jgi:hypothetical protein
MSPLGDVMLNRRKEVRHVYHTTARIDNSALAAESTRTA